VSKLLPESEVRYILATDVGSTTTKARFFGKVNGEWRLIATGEAPTTVEKPFEDVTIGVRNAVTEVEELTGHKILRDDGQGMIMPYQGGKVGIDVYVSTSSAGGGLQMLVMGVVKTMTAESAQKAALGAGAIVMDVLSVDDGRSNYEKIQILRFLRPDMILLAGGVDGGTVTHVLELAELLRFAQPKPRLGKAYKLPVVYAGNKDARSKIKELLGEIFDLRIVDNIRPKLEVERIEPARNAILELFMEHVMAHAPGYDKLSKWVSTSIMPTPAGEFTMIATFAKLRGVNVIGVGMGGATTNIYSVFEGRALRTVSANIGMSYSIGNILKEAGVENIKRWLPFEISDKDLKNIIYNKMIRPTTIPMTLEDLAVEHAVAREGIRLAFNHHKFLARELKGVKRERTISDIFEEVPAEETYLDMFRIHYIVGTGGLLSRAPRRNQAMMVLIDAFQPKGITRLVQDSVFMMPHLGVLSTIYPNIALELFEKECLVYLGTVVAPEGRAPDYGETVADITIIYGPKEEERFTLRFGEIRRVSLGLGKKARVIVKPSKYFNMGRGYGKAVEGEVSGGVVGVVFDGRGRPLKLPEDPATRRKMLIQWYKAMALYPEERLEEWAKS